MTSPLVAQTTNKSFSTSVSVNSMGNFTVPDFNTSQGVLDGITITLSLGGNTSMDIPPRYFPNYSPFTDFPQTLENDIEGPGGFSLDTVPGPTDLHFALNGPSNSPTTPATALQNISDSTTHYGPFTPGESITEQVNPNLFNAWENQSGGNVDLTHSDGNIICQGASFGNNLFNGQTGNEKVVIQYTFSPGTTPEPAGKYLTLMALGAAVWLVLRRRRELGASTAAA